MDLTKNDFQDYLDLSMEKLKQASDLYYSQPCNTYFEDLAIAMQRHWRLVNHEVCPWVFSKEEPISHE